MRDKLLTRSSRQPALQSASLVVGWNRDFGKLGNEVMDYINEKLGSRECGEVEPNRFFSFSGAAVEDNVVQFPECKLFVCEKNNLLLFKSDPPQREWYTFLNSIIDVAEEHATIKELYTIGGIVSLTSHTLTRSLLPVFSSWEMKESLNHYHLERDLDYQTPPGQRPTLNSFLLWIAKRRNIPGINLWVSIPFYLVTVGDAKAKKTIIDFFNQRFNLGSDSHDLEEEIRTQNEKIAQVRIRSSEIDGFVNKIEDNQNLSEEENVKLIKEIEEVFKKSG